MAVVLGIWVAFFMARVAAGGHAASGAWFVMMLVSMGLAIRVFRQRLAGSTSGGAYAAGRIIGAWRHPTAVGTLAQACFEPAIVEYAREPLARLLPKVTEADAARLTPDDLTALARLLYPFPNSTDPAADWPFVAGAARVLGMTAFEPALHALERARDGFLWAKPLPPELTETLAEAARSLRARISLAQQKQNLLRASTSLDFETASLLRPAAAGEEPAEQLLRPAQGETEQS
jgi:hypothetical protein